MVPAPASLALLALLQERRPWANRGAVAAALHSFDGIRRFNLPMQDSPAASPSVPKSRKKKAVPAGVISSAADRASLKSRSE